MTGNVAPPMEYNFANAAATILENRGRKVVENEHTVGRNIGLAGIGLAILFILVIVAIVTCFRRRKVLPIRQDIEEGQISMENACYAAPQDSPPEYGEVVDIYHISNDAPPNYADVMEMKNQNENGKQMESIKTLTDNLCETDFTIYKDHLIMPHDSTAEKEENVENSKDENDPQPQE